MDKPVFIGVVAFFGVGLLFVLLDSIWRWYQKRKKRLAQEETSTLDKSTKASAPQLNLDKVEPPPPLYPDFKDSFIINMEPEKVGQRKKYLF